MLFPYNQDYLARIITTHANRKADLPLSCAHALSRSKKACNQQNSVGGSPSVLHDFLLVGVVHVQQSDATSDPALAKRWEESVLGVDQQVRRTWDDRCLANHPKNDLTFTTKWKMLHAVILGPGILINVWSCSCRLLLLLLLPQYGCGSKPMVPFFSGAPPVLVYLSGDWDVHWGITGLSTHGHTREGDNSKAPEGLIWGGASKARLQNFSRSARTVMYQAFFHLRIQAREKSGPVPAAERRQDGQVGGCQLVLLSKHSMRTGAK